MVKEWLAGEPASMETRKNCAQDLTSLPPAWHYNLSYFPCVSRRPACGWSWKNKHWEQMLGSRILITILNWSWRKLRIRPGFSFFNMVWVREESGGMVQGQEWGNWPARVAACRNLITLKQGRRKKRMARPLNRQIKSRNFITLLISIPGIINHHA